MKKTIVSEVKKLAVVMFGIIICAFSVEAFGIPYNILVGGSTGTASKIGRASCRERV